MNNESVFQLILNKLDKIESNQVEMKEELAELRRETDTIILIVNRMEDNLI